MKGDVSFRKITEFPRGTLAELLEDGYSFEPMLAWFWKEQWRAFDDFFYDFPSIAETCGFITVLRAEPIGFVTWDPRKIPEYAEVGHNCIAAKYKGNGYGKQQMREAVSRMAACGARKIVVTTNEKLAAARRVYEHTGFRLVGIREEPICPAYAGKRLDYELIVPVASDATLPCDRKS